MSDGIIDSKIAAAPAQPQRNNGQKALPADTPAEGETGKVVRAVSPAKNIKLSPRERVGAIFTLLVWLHLFAGGMLIDTEPYRCTISWNGVKVVEPPKIHPCSAYWSVDAAGNKTFNKYIFPDISGIVGIPNGAKAVVQPVASWLIAILFYIPLNLAFISAAAGALGSMGNIANLNPDPRADGTAYDNPEPKGEPSFALKARADAEAELYGSRDSTNPYISGLLRGMFAYLFVISGMLLFDDAPFETPSPGQYIRLAGFLSLFSFIVNYQPSVFRSMLDGAQKLISTKGRGPAPEDAATRRLEEAIRALADKTSQLEAVYQRTTYRPTDGQVAVEQGRIGMTSGPNAQGQRSPDASADEPPGKDNHRGGDDAGGDNK